jgi:hypothetical protein
MKWEACEMSDPMAEAVRDSGVSEAPRPAQARTRFAARPVVRLAALVVLALLVGLVLWLAFGGRDSTPKRAPASAASVEGLRTLAAAVHHPVYWAGVRKGFKLELTRTSDGKIYIRYLPSGTPIGDDRPSYLTVSTYPVKNAVAAVRAIAKREKTSTVTLTGGGIAVQDVKHPTSVYFAYPGSDYQIEVYDPSPARARRAVLEGEIKPVGAGAGPTQNTTANPRSASASQLRALQTSLGHPVYWLGPRRGMTNELTRTSDSRIYIRYLPAGVKVGDRRPQTTVGTYPVANATAAVEAIAKRTKAKTFAVAHRGLAVVDAEHPTSVYVAFAGSKYEIEVFDPSAARARQLVSSGLVVPVG